MLTQAHIPSDLTDTRRDFIFQFLDSELNSMILFALLHGQQHHFVCSDVGADQ